MPHGPISVKEIETIVYSLPSKKSQGPDVFTAGFYQTLKEEVILIGHQQFQEIDEKKASSSWFIL